MVFVASDLHLLWFINFNISVLFPLCFCFGIIADVACCPVGFFSFFVAVCISLAKKD
jgi:hypothetical protein